MNQLANVATGAQTRFLEFFVNQIRNPNTRRASARAVNESLPWRKQQGVASIADVALPCEMPDFPFAWKWSRRRPCCAPLCR